MRCLSRTEINILSDLYISSVRVYGHLFAYYDNPVLAAVMITHERL